MCTPRLFGEQPEVDLELSSATWQAQQPQQQPGSLFCAEGPGIMELGNANGF